MPENSEEKAKRLSSDNASSFKHYGFGRLNSNISAKSSESGSSKKYSKDNYMTQKNAFYTTFWENITDTQEELKKGRIDRTNDPQQARKIASWQVEIHVTKLLGDEPRSSELPPKEPLRSKNEQQTKSFVQQPQAAALSGLMSLLDMGEEEFYKRNGITNPISIRCKELSAYSKQHPIWVYECKKVMSMSGKHHKKEDSELMKGLFPEAYEVHLAVT